MEEQGKDSRKELLQILFDVILIGAFSIIKSVLMFYYSGIVYVIFGVLELLGCCVLTVNVYRLISASGKKNDVQDNRQIQALLYKQMKKLEEKMPGDTSDAMQNVLMEQKEGFEQRTEELRVNQFRSVKAILAKIEETMQPQEESAGNQDVLDKLQMLEQQMEQMAQLQTELLGKLERIDESKAVKKDVQVPEEDGAEAEPVVFEEKNEETSAPVVEPLDEDANKQLSPEEIAALFASVN